MKTLLVVRQVECPFCDEELKVGDVLYKDKEDEEYCCGYCKEEYNKKIKKNV